MLQLSGESMEANVAVTSKTADAQLRGFCESPYPRTSLHLPPKGDRVLRGCRRGKTQSIQKAGHWELSHSAVRM